jgi:hypothetical protein
VEASCEICHADTEQHCDEDHTDHVQVQCGNWDLTSVFAFSQGRHPINDNAT